MTSKATENARMIFAWMVPITVAAFLLGAVTTISMAAVSLELQWPDYIGLITATAGVLMFNWFEEKPQKASIEQL